MVTVVSLMAFGLAVLLAIAAVQIAQYRVLFLCLGFMAMGGIFAVHGIDTPGIIKTGADAKYAGSVLGVSAYLSLFVPALFFAASYTPLTAAFERRLPFSPAGWLIVLLGTALGIYGALAVAGTEVIAELPFGVKPYSTAMGLTTIVLLLFSAWRQAGSYLVARLPLQGILVTSFILLAEADKYMQAPGYDHLGVLCDTRDEVDELLERARRWRDKDDRVKITEFAKDLVQGPVTVHAFYVRYLLPIQFDVQCIERAAGAEPEKRWQYM